LGDVTTPESHPIARLELWREAGRRGTTCRPHAQIEQLILCKGTGDAMYARIIQFTAKPGQGVNLLQDMRDRDLPMLKQQSGFIDFVVLSSETEPNQFVGISIWKSKEDAMKAIAGQGQQVLQSIRPLLQRDPILETFNVETSTIHNVGITRAASST
jgi:quinol monooxygenase YgiN